MPRPDVLAIVLAGGQGSRLGPLTAHRAKPAVPFAGHYRLIDFPLSNCLHSAVGDVWVMQQYQPASLNGHLSNGRPWDLDRTNGGLIVLPPYQGTEREGWSQGTADGLWRNAALIRQADPRVCVLVSADAVYRMDYRHVVAAHDASDAVLTMVTAEVDISEAGRYGVVQVDGNRVASYEYKPESPASNLVSNEVFVFNPAPVLDLLDELAEEAGDEGLQDLGNVLLPRLADEGRAGSFRFSGYWRDVGTIDSYFAANMAFASADPPIDVDDPTWPVRTKGGLRAAAMVDEPAEIRGSLVSAGCVIAGSVVHSVVGPGVRIEPGARVSDSILLPGAIVERDARVTRSIIDDDVVVGRGAVVGGDDAITVIGDRSRLAAGQRVAARQQLPADDG